MPLGAFLMSKKCLNSSFEFTPKVDPPLITFVCPVYDVGISVCFEKASELRNLLDLFSVCSVVKFLLVKLGVLSMSLIACWELRREKTKLWRYLSLGFIED